MSTSNAGELVWVNSQPAQGEVPLINVSQSPAVRPDALVGLHGTRISWEDWKRKRLQNAEEFQNRLDWEAHNMRVQRAHDSNVMRHCAEMGLAFQAAPFLPEGARTGYLQYHCGHLDLGAHGVEPAPPQEGPRQLTLCWDNSQEEQFREPRGSSKRARRSDGGAGAPVSSVPVSTATVKAAILKEGLQQWWDHTGKSPDTRIKGNVAYNKMVSECAKRVAIHFNHDRCIVECCRTLRGSVDDWALKSIIAAIKIAITGVRLRLQADEALASKEVAAEDSDAIWKHHLFVTAGSEGEHNGTFNECVAETFNHTRYITQMMPKNEPRGCVEAWNKTYDGFIKETQHAMYAFKGNG